MPHEIARIHARDPRHQRSVAASIQAVTGVAGRLRPGMYVTAEVPQDAEARHVVLPSTSIQYAPYGDMVFII